MSGSETADSKAVTFEGDFTPDERALLAKQFGRCHFRLIRRSQRAPSCAIISWRPAAGVTHGPEWWGGAIPAAAVYVISGDQLVRARTREEVEHALGEPLGDLPLPGLTQSNPVWEGAKQALRGLVPWR
jgi:hypothetical protein